MNENAVHSKQITEGRLGLSVRPGYGGPSRPQGSAPARKQFVAKGHDAILKEMQDSGGQIVVLLISSDTVIRGRLVARDKFTLTVLVGDVRHTIYKHAIESFASVTVQ